MDLYGLNMNGVGNTLPSNPIFATQQKITEVDGLKGAMSVNMGPNSGMLALDTTKPILWVIRTDQNCNKLDPLMFDISPHVPEPDPAVKSLENRVSGLEDQLSGMSDTLKRIEELIK